MKPDIRAELLRALVAILPLAAVGALLTAFKETLPALLYETIIWIVALVICAVLIWLVVQLMFITWVQKLISYERARNKHRKEVLLVDSWSRHWSAFANYLAKMFSDSPSEGAEILDSGSYLKHRDWFMRTRSTFLPIYRAFDRSRVVPAHEDNVEQYTIRWEVLRVNQDDPFSFFYQPLISEHAEHIIRRYPDTEVLYVLTELKDRCEELRNWLMRK